MSYSPKKLKRSNVVLKNKLYKVFFFYTAHHGYSKLARDTKSVKLPKSNAFMRRPPEHLTKKHILLDITKTRTKIAKRSTLDM